MQAYKVRGRIGEGGSLTLENLPFPVGAEVEVIVLAEASKTREQARYPLRGTDVWYTDLGLTREEIVAFVREGRDRG